MKKFKCMSVCFLVILAVFVAAPSAFAVDESVEPADTYRLSLNDVEIDLFPDRDIELPENAGKAKARLIVNPEKRFTYGDVDFQYPRYFTFEADLNEAEVRLWSLSGNKAVLMVQRYPVEMDHKVMAEQLLPSFGEGNSTLGVCEMMFNGVKTTGSRVITTIGQGTIAQDIYSFDMANGSLLLILQDTLEDDRNSDEFKAFCAQLSRTFKITEAEKK
ncbi:MAG: hypothetical protein GX569_04690 [Candidatus Riflebacteria bacterium]|nr:hypothetical protein [Candidatus Riflebacteria bacterium]